MSKKHERHAKAPPTDERAVTHDEVSVEDLVRKRAFEIYLSREGGPGDALGDWLQAEREIIGDPSANADETRNGK